MEELDNRRVASRRGRDPTVASIAGRWHLPSYPATCSDRLRLLRVGRHEAQAIAAVDNVALAKLGGLASRASTKMQDLYFGLSLARRHALDGERSGVVLPVRATPEPTLMS